MPPGAHALAEGLEPFTYTNPATLYVAKLQCKCNSYKKRHP